MDIDKYPEISVDLFYSKSVTTPRCIAGTKAKTVHEQLPGEVQEAVKLAKSSSIEKAQVNERKRNAFADTSKIQSKKTKLGSDNAVFVDHNYNIVKDPAQRKRSKPFTIFLSKNIDDDSDDDSDDEMEKSIKDYEENALKHDKVEKKKKSELPARYLSSNISFQEDPEEALSVEEFFARLHMDDGSSHSHKQKTKVTRSISLTTLINTLEGTNL